MSSKRRIVDAEWSSRKFNNCSFIGLQALNGASPLSSRVLEFSIPTNNLGIVIIQWYALTLNILIIIILSFNLRNIFGQLNEKWIAV